MATTLSDTWDCQRRASPAVSQHLVAAPSSHVFATCQSDKNGMHIKQVMYGSLFAVSMHVSGILPAQQSI